jgi:hypothetical protein
MAFNIKPWQKLFFISEIRLFSFFFVYPQNRLFSGKRNSNAKIFYCVIPQERQAITLKSTSAKNKPSHTKVLSIIAANAAKTYTNGEIKTKPIIVGATPCGRPKSNFQTG